MPALRNKDCNYISNKESKFFVTDNEAELQVATFNLEKNDNILKHIHPPQQRLSLIHI